jgi:predicted DCC family thiol-disulfide oxidoreductase YuxK
MGTANEIRNPIIFFDGVCNLCNSSVNFVIDKDPNNKFKFAPLQSQFAKETIPETYRSIDSIILMKNGVFYTKSDAALHIAKDLKGIVRYLWYYIFIPKFIRDWVYDLIAKSRYNVFGKKDMCRIPTPELQNRFISSPIVS